VEQLEGPVEVVEQLEDPVEVVEQLEEPVEEQLAAPVEIEEPLSPLDALAEIQALAEQQAEMEAEQALEPEVPEVPQVPEVQAPEPQAPELQAPELQAPELQAPDLQAAPFQDFESQVPEEAPDPVEALVPEPPLELVDQLGAGPSPDEDDDSLSEIDQILARAREAAQAQAAKILEDEPQEPPLSPKDQTAALLAGLEQQDEVTPSAGRGIPEDIRTAVEESLGGGARESDSRSRGKDPFQAVIQAEANMAGVEAQADSGEEEQNLADRKDSSHPDYRSRGDESDSGLISSNTAAGAIAALGDLSRAARETTGGQGGAATALGMNRTLEELVLDAMTPHLKAWLDANLEPLVERVVREEIQRLRRRSEDY
jgi:cell pole-organizing protein PopZ